MIEIALMIVCFVFLMGIVPWWAGFGGFMMLLYLLVITKNL